MLHCFTDDPSEMDKRKEELISKIMVKIAIFSQFLQEIHLIFDSLSNKYKLENLKKKSGTHKFISKLPTYYRLIEY